MGDSKIRMNGTNQRPTSPKNANSGSENETAANELTNTEGQTRTDLLSYIDTVNASINTTWWS